MLRFHAFSMRNLCGGSMKNLLSKLLRELNKYGLAESASHNVKNYIHNF